MALNEAAGHRRGGLTKEQKREAEAAIFGLQENPTMPSKSNISEEDYERMRALLAEHDNGGRSKIQQFDLNDPPKVPYVHQEYPKMVYDHSRRHHKTVRNEKELLAAIDDGYEREPYASEPPPPPQMDAATLAEVERVDAELKKKATKK